jgi:hypothetical protein
MSGIADSLANASSVSFAAILPSGHVCWGVLEQLEPVGSGLIRAKVSGTKYLVDDSLLSRLSGLMGQQIVIGHIDEKWGAGTVTA